MKLLAHVTYDPAASVNETTATLIAMTAMDTTNLRVTFTAPASGTVMVRLSGTQRGTAGSTHGQCLVGILDGSTVKVRIPCVGDRMGQDATERRMVFNGHALVKGLTPGNSYTWDVAYSVETIVGSAGIIYGGPNDTTGGNAFGCFSCEVYG